MKSHRLTLAFGLISLFSNVSAHADFTYTFTTKKFDYLLNTVQEGPLSKVDDKSFLKFVITTDEALQSNRQYGTLDILNMGSIEASMGDLRNDFNISDYNASQPDFIRIELNSFDKKGLPDAWNIQLIGDNVPFGEQNIESLNFYTRSLEEKGESFSQIQAAINFEPFNYLYGESYKGSWEVAEISSPVPEPETYAMLMAGLGLIGFVSRKKHNKVA